MTGRPRLVIFRVLAVVLAVLAAELGIAFLGMVSPWVPIAPPDTPDSHFALHRWHEAQHWPVQVFLVGGPLLALAWRPSGRPMLLRIVLLVLAIAGLSVVVTGLSILGDPRAAQRVGGVIILGVFLILVPWLLVALYPWRRSVFAFAAPGGILLLLTIVAAAGLAIDVARSVNFQLTAPAGDEHVLWGHWISAIRVALGLVCAGLVAAGREAGWRLLAGLCGACYLYLGAAAIRLPDQAGSWGIVGGVLAALLGAAYLVVAVRGAAAERSVVPAPAV